MPEIKRNAKSVKKVDFTKEEYRNFSDIWKTCRDVISGSEAVKNSGTRYLPQLKDQLSDDYKKYKDRALFFEGAGRAVNAFVGMLFSKDPTVVEDDTDFLSSLVTRYSSLKAFLKKICTEVLTVGRVGVLVDVDSLGKPYFSIYYAEDIINWRTSGVGADDTLTLVVLVEGVCDYSGFEEVKSTQYRVLALDDKDEYIQTVYVKDQKSKDGDTFILKEGPIKPTRKGKPLKKIPFTFINVSDNSPNPTRPPLTGLVNANLSHYKNSADLEHGRHFTGLPTPWAAGFNMSGDNKFKIGSQKAWVTGKVDAKVGYLEFTGQGLGSLENALKEKHGLMMILGARMLEVPKSIAESADNQANRKEGENSILASLADTVSQSMNIFINIAAEWDSKDPKKYSTELSREFSKPSIQPETLKYLIASIQGGLISYETFFYNLKRSGLYAMDVNLDEEKENIRKTLINIDGE